MSITEIIAEIRNIIKSERRSFSRKDAEDLWNQMGLTEVKYDRTEFWLGLNVELEHGPKAGPWNITNNDPIMTAKIALAHMDESPTYYKDLKKYVDPS